jgi:signal transduction histidine kinase
VLAAWRGTPDQPYTEDDRVLLEDLADRAGLAIERARLYHEARDRAAAEAALNAALQEAILARDEFLALVSHDLKNPLTTVKGTAQVIRRQLQRGVALDPERHAGALAAIEAAAARATDQIDGLLDAARLQSGQPLDLERRPVDLIALVRGVVAEHQRTTERHAIRIASDLPELAGSWDAARLERVLANLLSNAVKYSPDRGDVTVEVACERGEAEDWAVIAVRDRLVGIPAASLARVFERFHRAANVVGRIPGTGIGLSGVKQIVEQHGGRVTVESTEGVGSTFAVRLPLAPSDGAVDAVSP